MKAPTRDTLRALAKGKGLRVTEGDDWIMLRDDDRGWDLKFVFDELGYKDWYGGPLERSGCLDTLKIAMGGEYPPIPRRILSED